jgi:hypothetical protein
VHRDTRLPTATKTLRPSDFEHFARVNLAGELTQQHGCAQQLAALSKFACNVVDGVGELLGLGRAQAIEATFAGGTLVTLREPDGSIVAFKPMSER